MVPPGRGFVVGRAAALRLPRSAHGDRAACDRRRTLAELPGRIMRIFAPNERNQSGFSGVGGGGSTGGTGTSSLSSGTSSRGSRAPSRRGPSDDAAGAQAGDLLLGEAQLAQDLVGVRPKTWGEPAHL